MTGSLRSSMRFATASRCSIFGRSPGSAGLATSDSANARPRSSAERTMVACTRPTHPRRGPDHSDWDALCGITCDESGRPTQLRWDKTGGIVTRDNIWRRAIGSTLFLRRSLVESLGEWDESFGPRPHEDGTIRGGSEDGEYLL